MKGIIVYNREVAVKREWYIGKYIEAFAERGVECSLVCTDEIDEGVSADFVIMRDINPGLSSFFEEKGIRVFNSAFVSKICNDKLATYKYIEDRQLATFLPVIEAGEYNDDWKMPCVLKSKNGHGGTEVFWIENEDELRKELEGRDIDNYILQQACNMPGIDVRVYVIGGEIIAAMKRIGRKSEDIHESFRSNYCLGGSCEIYNIEEDKEMLAMVRRIGEKLCPDFVGIDFIFHDGQAIFNEIEDVVGSRMVYDFTDIDIVDKYVEYMLDSIN